MKQVSSRLAALLLTVLVAGCLEFESQTLSFSEADYTPNALEPAGKQHVVKESFDPVAAARKFLLQEGGEK